MQPIIKILEEKFRSACQMANFPPCTIEIVTSSKEQFGHYQCNSAMPLAKELKMAPRQIAEKIVSNVEKGVEITQLEIAGPGFINITLSPEFLSEQINQMRNSKTLGVPVPNKPEKVIVEFSSPNIAKELHVGHLRSTIIGDSIARLFEFMGQDVLRLNHIGDWGTSFGMLIAYLKDKAPEVVEGKESPDLLQLETWYKEAKKRFDEDPAFKKTSQLQVVALQSGEPQARRAWEIICDISRKAYQEIYDLLDVKLNERGESFYNPMLPDVIHDLEEKGIVQISNGAKCLFLDGFVNREGSPLPMIIQKSDGGYNYSTTDLAAIKHRIQEENADRIIIVTDAGQKLHFKMIFAAAEKADYLDQNKVRVDHVPFGLVLGPDGKKFQTRSGKTEKLIDLLTEAVHRAKAIVDTRAHQVPEDEKMQLASSLGIGAIKYADLSSHRMSDYTFSYDRMLQFEGNTAAFMMYSYVRIQGIKRKIGKEIDPSEQINLKHHTEIALGLHLLRFSEACIQMASELLPNRLTEYLYLLAEKFNAFYRDCQVEGSEDADSRLLLCELTARVLKQGLSILGVKTVSRM
ncbi:MAG: arginine--tRNA ligase [Waddliaceae bacterium]